MRNRKPSGKLYRDYSTDVSLNTVKDYIMASTVMTDEDKNLFLSDYTKLINLLQDHGPQLGTNAVTTPVLTPMEIIRARRNPDGSYEWIEMNRLMNWLDDWFDDPEPMARIAVKEIYKMMNNVIAGKQYLCPTSLKYDKETLEYLKECFTDFLQEVGYSFLSCHPDKGASTVVSGDPYDKMLQEMRIICDKYYREHPKYKAFVRKRAYRQFEKVTLENEEESYKHPHQANVSAPTEEDDISPALAWGFQSIQGIEYTLAYALDEDFVHKLVEDEIERMENVAWEEFYLQESHIKDTKPECMEMDKTFDEYTYKEMLEQLKEFLCDVNVRIAVTELVWDYRMRCYPKSTGVWADAFSCKPIRAVIYALDKDAVFKISPKGKREIKALLGRYLAKSPYAPKNKRNDTDCIRSANKFLKLSASEVKANLDLSDPEQIKAYMILLEFQKQGGWQNWHVPVEWGMSTSMFQILGCILHMKEVLERTNLFNEGNQMVDFWQNVVDKINPDRFRDELKGDIRNIVKAALMPIPYGLPMKAFAVIGSVKKKLDIELTYSEATEIIRVGLKDPHFNFIYTWIRLLMKYGGKDVTFSPSYSFGDVLCPIVASAHEYPVKDIYVVRKDAHLQACYVKTDQLQLTGCCGRLPSSCAYIEEDWDTFMGYEAGNISMMLPTALVHHLDALMANYICLVLRSMDHFVLPIHDAFIVMPDDICMVRGIALCYYQYLYNNGTTIVDSYIKSVGIEKGSKGYNEVMDLATRSPYRFIQLHGHCGK